MLSLFSPAFYHSIILIAQSITLLFVYRVGVQLEEIKRAIVEKENKLNLLEKNLSETNKKLVRVLDDYKRSKERFKEEISVLKKGFTNNLKNIETNNNLSLLDAEKENLVLKNKNDLTRKRLSFQNPTKSSFTKRFK